MHVVRKSSLEEARFAGIRRELAAGAFRNPNRPRSRLRSQDFRKTVSLQNR